MIDDSLKTFGKLHIVVRDPEGNIKHDVEVPNTVVNGGKAFIAQSMLKTTTNSPAAMTHMGFGTGTTAAAVGQTTLVTEAGTRAGVTATNVTVTNTNDAAQYVATFAAGNPATLTAITEAGVFNASTAGTMLCRTTFSAINKDVNDTMTITWKVQIT